MSEVIWLISTILVQHFMTVISQEEFLGAEMKSDIAPRFHYPVTYDFIPLRHSINHSADACKDFYHYVCAHPLHEYPRDENIWHAKKLADIPDEIERHPIKEHKKLSETYALLSRQCRYAMSNNDLDLIDYRAARVKKLLKMNEENRTLTDFMIELRPMNLYYNIERYSDSTAGEETIIIKFNHKNLMKMENIRLNLLPKVGSSSSAVAVARYIGNALDKAVSNISDDSSLLALRSMGLYAPSVDWVRYVKSVLPANLLRKLTKRGSIENITIRTENINKLKLYDKYIINNLAYETVHVAIASELQFHVDAYSCRDMLTHSFNDLFERLYSERYAKPNPPLEYIKEAERLIEGAYRRHFESSKLITTELASAIDKLYKINFIHGAPHLEKNIFDELYHDLDMSAISDSHTFYDNFRVLAAWRVTRSYMTFLPTIPLQHDIRMQTRYTPEWNRVDISNLFLSEPYLNATRPIGLNYGMFGYLASYLTGRAFDSAGAEFDSAGAKKPIWSRSIFTDRRDCFAAKHSVLRKDPSDLNLTALDEDNYMAQYYGIRMAFDAMKEKFRSDPILSEDRLYNLDQYNMEQQFFLSFALMHCRHPKESTTSIDIYGPPRYRVILPLTNMPEFAEAFNCKVGTAMNLYKCDVL